MWSIICVQVSFFNKRFGQTQTSLTHLVIILLVLATSTYFTSNSVLAQGTADSLDAQLRIIDPNPKLIDLESGALINDVSIIDSINETRIGAIADGVSKLLLVAKYENPLKFTLLDNEDNNQSKGTLSTLFSTSTSPELQNPQALLWILKKQILGHPL